MKIVVHTIAGVAFMAMLCNANEPAWDLERAEKRIRQHRMSDAVVEITLPDGMQAPAGVTATIEQTGHEFHFGGFLGAARVYQDRPEFETYLKRFSQVFNYATLPFYWSQHERQPGTWMLNEHTEKAMRFARERGMTTKGHPMMWHNTLPAFVEQEPSVEKIDRYVMDHVRMLASNYTQVDQWDLYNETPGIRLKPAENGARRWVESLGGPGPCTQKIVSAVRQVQPNGYFLLNHFRHDDPQYHDQIRYCLDHGVDFSAIGIQTHMHKKPDVITPQQLWNMLQRFAQYKKPIHLTEVSIVSCEPLSDWRQVQQQEAVVERARRNREPDPAIPSTADGERQQAESLREFYTIAFSHPNVEAIVWWSISDEKAWRGMPSGLLDEQLNPKPAYETLNQLINHQWRTSERCDVDERGRVSFRGFRGDYRITLAKDGVKLNGTFRLTAESPSVTSVSLQ
ncbi:endo-1,4-beta-xylanase [Crateriforma conspicua]|nr:endo-1,4-beta-xylanase [Crateriforma conspicua]